MTIQVAVRLSDEVVHEIDALVAAGAERSRASVIERSLVRELRRLRFVEEAEILRRPEPDADLDDLAAYTARTPLDID